MAAGYGRVEEEGAVMQLCSAEQFCAGLRTLDVSERARALAHIEDVVLRWAADARSAGPVGETARALQSLKAYSPVLLRLSSECPFDDVRRHCAALLAKLRELGGVPLPRRAVPGPSRFVPLADIATMDAPQSALQDLLEDCFIQDARLSHMVRIMHCHPDFLRAFINTHHVLVRRSGPLPSAWRFYIAAMAASRFECDYLIHLLEDAFIAAGGDATWLSQGLSAAPAKLQALSVLNALLAHQPWHVTADHMRSLLRSEDSQWSLTELVQAVCLLVQYHALAGFVWACGIAPEIDKPGGHTFDEEGKEGGDATGPQDLEAADPERVRRRSTWVTALAERLIKLTASQEDEEDDAAADEDSAHMPAPASSGAESARASEGASDSDDGSKDQDSGLLVRPANGATNALATPPSVRSAAYMAGSELPIDHLDVRVKPEEVLRVQDYSWSEHGYAIVDHYYEDIAPHLDKEFSVTRSFTYNRLGREERSIATVPLREAVWHFAHKLQGVMHDDYKYKLIPDLLDCYVQQFITLTVCSPQSITLETWANAGIGFLPSERIHIAMLTHGAVKQAKLMYALRAIMRLTS